MSWQQCCARPGLEPSIWDAFRRMMRYPRSVETTSINPSAYLVSPSRTLLIRNGLFCLSHRHVMIAQPRLSRLSCFILAILSDALPGADLVAALHLDCFRASCIDVWHRSTLFFVAQCDCRMSEMREMAQLSPRSEIMALASHGPHSTGCSRLWGRTSSVREVPTYLPRYRLLVSIT